MSMLTRRDSRSLFPDVFEWLEPSFTVLRPFSAQTMRTEEYIEEGRYVVRAELPGIDPEKHAEVTVSKGILTIHAERHDEATSKHHSEFRYGSFTRHVALPAAADETDIQASYDNGILEVSVGLKAKDEKDTGHRIPVQLVQHVKPA